MALSSLSLLFVLLTEPLLQELADRVEREDHRDHDRQEQRNVDGVLLLAREVQQGQHARIEEGPLGRNVGLLRFSGCLGQTVPQ